MIDRLLRLVAVLLQCMVYAALTPVTAALIGAATGAEIGHTHASTLLGAKIGGAIGVLLAVAGVPMLLSEPFGAAGFAWWWVRETLAPLLSAAISVWGGYVMVPAVSRLKPFGCDLDQYLGWISVLVALFIIFPVALGALRIITGPATQQFLAERVAGGLQRFRDVQRRAHELGAERPFEPPPEEQ